MQEDKTARDKVLVCLHPRFADTIGAERGGGESDGGRGVREREGQVFDQAERLSDL